jgi:hypothetical protein
MPSEKRSKKIVRKVVLAYSIRNRQRKADRILAFAAENGLRTVLLVGVAGDEHAGDPKMIHSGIVEKRIAQKCEIKMSISVDAAVVDYPFMIADVKEMPFADNYVDLAIANAIIEHVGGEAEQRQMVDEMTRVARAWIITTPNRWFPVESHTHALLLHWFPSWREKNAQHFTRLLSRREFQSMLPAGARLLGRPWSPTFMATYSR